MEGLEGGNEKEKQVQVWAGKPAPSLAMRKGTAAGKGRVELEKLNMKSQLDPVIPLLLTDPKD